MSADMNGMRKCVRMIRRLPIIMGSVMTLHCALLVFNIRLSFTEYVCGTSFTTCWLLLLFSRAFRFCLLHRLFIIYTMLASGCIAFERLIGFGVFLHYARLTMLLLGVVLHVALYSKTDCLC